MVDILLSSGILVECLWYIVVQIVYVVFLVVFIVEEDDKWVDICFVLMVLRDYLVLYNWDGVFVVMKRVVRLDYKCER